MRDLSDPGTVAYGSEEASLGPHKVNTLHFLPSSNRLDTAVKEMFAELEDDTKDPALMN